MVNGAQRLPDGWSWIELGEISELITKGSSPNWQGFEYQSSGITFVRSQNIGWGNLELDSLVYLPQEFNHKEKKSIIHKDDVLLNIVGASIGRCAKATSVIAGGNLNQAVAIIRLKQDAVLPDYAVNYLLTPDAQHKINLEKVDVARANLSLADIRRLSIPLPPLPEQERIVAKIEELFTQLDAGTSALAKVQAGLRRYTDSVLNSAINGQLVTQSTNDTPAQDLLHNIYEERIRKWKSNANSSSQKKKAEKYKEPELVDDSTLPSLPTGWAWATLDQIGQEGRPVIYGIIKPGPHMPDGIPYVRVTEMKDGHININELRRTSIERAKKFARATLAEGDLLISKDGTIGRVAVVPPELVGGNITQHVMRAPIHHLMDRDYVVWAVRSPFCQRWLKGETRGVALQGVNVEDFRRLPIPIPPIEEQRRIVAEVERRLSVAREVESVVEKALVRASRLRQAVLKSAFEGKLVNGL